jgi:hypothetical protein
MDGAAGSRWRCCHMTRRWESERGWWSQGVTVSVCSLAQFMRSAAQAEFGGLVAGGARVGVRHGSRAHPIGVQAGTPRHPPPLLLRASTAARGKVSIAGINRPLPCAPAHNRDEYAILTYNKS